MRKNRPAPKRILLDRCDVPPALIGDPDVDTEAGLAFLWAHEDSWPANADKDDANMTGDAA